MAEATEVEEGVVNEAAATLGREEDDAAPPAAADDDDDDDNDDDWADGRMVCCWLGRAAKGGDINVDVDTGASAARAAATLDTRDEEDDADEEAAEAGVAGTVAGVVSEGSNEIDDGCLVDDLGDVSSSSLCRVALEGLLPARPVRGSLPASIEDATAAADDDDDDAPTIAAVVLDVPLAWDKEGVWEVDAPPLSFGKDSP